MWIQHQQALAVLRQMGGVTLNSRSSAPPVTRRAVDAQGIVAADCVGSLRLLPMMRLGLKGVTLVQRITDLLQL